ncbi:unnamed protein product [Rotaria sp. Silwood2]|nr:unnamed protein product [Rotaria sp. Silwood2]
MSNRNIHLICRLIRPENVISLLLSGSSQQPDKLALFLSRIQIERFTRLHSLSFSDVKDETLDKVLRHVNTNALRSLSLFSSSLVTQHTMDLISSILAKNSLRKLHFDTDFATIDQISWPAQCTLEQITINECNDQQILTILRQSRYLRTLSLKNVDLRKIDQTLLADSFDQLVSLTLDCRNTSMGMLETFLSLTPSITHFGLNCLDFSGDCLRRFSECESFIQNKLPRLNTFTFSIQCSDYDYDDIEYLLLPFRTEFWLKQKRWFITCKYTINSSKRSVKLQSSSISEFDFADGYEGKVIMCASCTKTSKAEPVIKSTWSVHMNFAEIVNYIAWNSVSS